MMQSMQEIITEKLQKSLDPSQLEVVNESHLHKGHSGDDGSGESHFKIVISGGKFQSESRVKKHQEVYEILSKEMMSIHALSISIR